MTQAAVATALHISQGTLAGLESEAQGSSHTAALARLYGCDVHWLSTGEGRPNYTAKRAGTPGAMRNSRRVWVVGQTRGGLPERVWTDGDQPIGATDEFADISTTDEHAFACRVSGESMSPRYRPGEYALVEPDTAPEIEDDVLVRLATGGTMLKRLLGLRGGIRLGSYNNPEIMTFEAKEISWMYYVAHPIPARKIMQRVEVDRPHEDLTSQDQPNSEDRMLGSEESRRRGEK